jgi:phosphoribosylaminoimidazole (AIR) synthetase
MVRLSSFATELRGEDARATNSVQRQAESPNAGEELNVREARPQMPRAVTNCIAMCFNDALCRGSI